MPKRRLRTLSFAGEGYLWRREHLHSAQTGNQSHDACTERLSIYCSGDKKSPLRIRFIANSEWQVGYPEAGVVWSATQGLSFNLNHPALVKALIIALLPSWQALGFTRPYEVDDGIAFLIQLSKNGVI